MAQLWDPVLQLGEKKVGIPFLRTLIYTIF